MKHINVFVTLLVLVLSFSFAQKSDNTNSSIFVLSSSDNYSNMNLNKLDYRLKNKKIVLLGEQSHGDGTTFEIKTEIVKYLHSKLGFEIIAFESGFYDCMKVGESIKSGNDPIEASRLGIFRIWSKSIQTKGLFKYIAQQSKTNKPLELLGFDCQPTGRYSRDSMLIDLLNYVNSLKPEFNKSNGWNIFNNGAMNLYSRDGDGFNHIGVDTFSAACKNVISVIENSRATKNEYEFKKLFWIQIIKNIEVYSKLAFSQSNAVWQKRDTQMAENIVWLSKRFPSKKIIVWAATDHILKNQSYINGNTYDSNTLDRMGHILNSYFGNEMYSIGFTAYGGNALNIGTNMAYALQPPSRGSLEDILSGVQGEVLFVDYQNSNTSLRQKLGEKFISRPLGNAEMAGNWMKCLDGIVFIRNTKASIIEK